MQDWQHNTARAWDLGPDIITELRLLKDEEDEQLPTIEPAFDPVAFQEAHPQLKKADYRLTEEQLKSKGLQASEIRKRIADKAKEYER